MVYESSTRRIYSSSPRPVISTSYSYSPAGPIPVTGIRRQPHLVLTYAPGSDKGYVVNPLAAPKLALRRLAPVVPPPRRHRNGQNYYDMLESGITGNFGNRIVLVRYRPSPPPVPQSRVVYIEDVTDSSTCGLEKRLLRRERSPSPSFIYGSPWDAPAGMISRPMFSLHNIPLRSASEVKEVADMRRLYVRDRNPDVGYSPMNKALLYRMPLPVYVDPTIPQNYYIGHGNLACLSFAGGRPIPKRRRFFPEYYEEDKIREDVVFRSFYAKLRDAASPRSAGKRPIYLPISYSKKTILGEANLPKRKPKESKWVERALANEKSPPPRATKPALATETVAPPPRKESIKLEQKPQASPPIKPVNVTLPGPRKSVTEIIKDDVPKVESLPEEAPAKEPTPPPRAKTPPPPKEPTPPPRAKTPPPPKEPTPPPKEPTPPPAKEPTPPREPTPEPTPAVMPSPVPDTEIPPPKPIVEAGSEIPVTPTDVSEPPAEGSSDNAETAAPTTNEAPNKGEVESSQLGEQSTPDEVCEEKENDLEIEPENPDHEKVIEGSTASEQTAEPAVVASPEVTAVQAEAKDQDAGQSPAPVSIVVADIDGPIGPISPPAVPDDPEGQTPMTVDEIQNMRQKRQEEFAQLLEEHAELVTTVTKLEKVAVIVSKSCMEALAQQDQTQQQSPSPDSPKSK